MTLSDLLQRRRAVRYFDPEHPLDNQKVKYCLQLGDISPNEF